MRFSWNSIRERLASAPETVPGRRESELGSPALPSMSFKVLRLAPRNSFRRGPVTANAIFAVMEGEGACDVDERAFVFKRGDVIAVPAACRMICRTTAETYLLRVSDEPLLRDLGWLRAIPT